VNRDVDPLSRLAVLGDDAAGARGRGVLAAQRAAGTVLQPTRPGASPGEAGEVDGEREEREMRADDSSVLRIRSGTRQAMNHNGVLSETIQAVVLCQMFSRRLVDLVTARHRLICVDFETLKTVARE